ncbi:MAG: flavodoxin-dependent (E)-4-hydroxy-3-methylbut-2-enyl-diphosphate synthase [Candidatus Magnetoovum sp. WYHC-5]|nr:flavodoxin-dependent (E)-4-hydroxy-3-methylbut-2-enyl-diphosphate synthase [Candidatus Magnetoovum sp. WYHC-5]
MIKRRSTKKINIGTVNIGGDSPISVQSMTKTDTRDVNATVRQIVELEKAGCEIVRLAVLNESAADAILEIKQQVSIPMVADIHFDWKLAKKAISNGIDGLRINPGNIGAQWKVQELVEMCKDKDIPIRIGVNAGSLEKELLNKYGHPTPEAIVESAMRHIEILETLAFSKIKVSLKASNVSTTVEAYRLFSKQYDYPLHIGISEAGPAFSGMVKSAVGLGILLNEGIGDTMRVSLTAQPFEEVRVAYEILKSLNIRQHGVNIVSCPTCGRTRVNLMQVVADAERKFMNIDKNVTVAIMGCEVNGPGEAKEADYGIASGTGEGILFKKGQVIGKVKEEEMLESLIGLINSSD